MSTVGLMHEYVLANGEVPTRLGELVELEATLGDKFEYSTFNAMIVRGLLGLDGRSPFRLPDHERFRLVCLLHRMQLISESELTDLGMVARPIEESLARVRRNIRQNRAQQVQTIDR
jgi:hypothetical protein